jgi:CDP-diacylglycerol---glycerol-3-phosphate 3-phosphatidyltransferase
LVSIYELKPRFQALLRPAMHRLHRMGLTPNAVTGLSIAASIAVGAAVAFAGERPRLLLLLPLWLFLRMALNAIDGMMARELDLTSSSGAILNEVGDVVSDAALYLPLALVEPRALWGVVAFAFGGALTEFCGVLGQALGTRRQYQGPMGKSDRAFVAGALALVTAFLPAVREHWIWVFGLAAALTAVTCWNRLRAALEELK